jgi:hypothetical protein
MYTPYIIYAHFSKEEREDINIFGAKTLSSNHLHGLSFIYSMLPFLLIIELINFHYVF